MFIHKQLIYRADFPPHLFWPDSQVEVEARLQQQILHVIRVDGEVEIQRVSQQLEGFLIAVTASKQTEQMMQLNRVFQVSSTRF